ncbi:tetratricopeptide repeat-containing diguanylate cyclase [Pseudomarimonas arenosa]|uniref:diguanylate cyclase n=1 Tax=Pseudomarimonas arenosa TaxID=2774145 RepID=A0AAW3ZRT6_9GAMM|nr:GGDEF domain-containing protein [Pseudomarimonas arenosa]MBD8527817.1 diguanylate cyclase [Pseudomarimonas arenosa]
MSRSLVSVTATPVLVAALIALIAFATPLRAEISYAEFRSLPALPELYEELDDPARLAWLQAELARASSAVEIYRLKRVLFNELYYADKRQEAARICAESEPLREDIFYRQRCILSRSEKVEESIPLIAQLVHEARQLGNHSAAAEILTDLAWEQSQQGDISAAFESYETALTLAPPDDTELLSTIMMDTATNYIVNGDEAYVRKGIDLLRRSREQSERALNNPRDTSDKSILQDNILLAYFNTGIAYTLHLHDYAKALHNFDQVNDSENDYRSSSLTFSALAAAELGDFERARAYLRRAQAEKITYFTGREVVQGYLSCYQQLTARHWDESHSLSSCLTLDPDTTVEVQLDVYRRLAASNDADIELAGLKALKTLFIEKLEPQLRRRGSSAASNTELVRLQRESELKSVVLKQQEDLQQERELANAQRQKFFIALTVSLLAVALLIASQLRQKKRLAEQYERMSVRDSLTQLGNRRALEQQIERELAYIVRARRSNDSVALAIFLFDIDHFKKINDTYGHQVGDEVLIELGKRISVATRETDLLVRWGGEEFVLVARVDSSERIRQLAERIVRAVNSLPFDIKGREPLAVTCTVGAVKFPFIDTDHLGSWNRLISLADAALYHGKSQGRNGWVIVDNKGLASTEAIDALLAKPLSEAIEQGAVSITSSWA